MELAGGGDENGTCSGQASFHSLVEETLHVLQNGRWFRRGGGQGVPGEGVAGLERGTGDTGDEWERAEKGEKAVEMVQEEESSVVQEVRC